MEDVKGQLVLFVTATTVTTVCDAKSSSHCKRDEDFENLTVSADLCCSLEVLQLLSIHYLTTLYLNGVVEICWRQGPGTHSGQVSSPLQTIHTPPGAILRLQLTYICTFLDCGRKLRY